MRRLIALLLMLFALLAMGCDTARSEPALTVAALSIGKADSILLTDGAHSVLIDAGEEDDGDKVLDALAEAGVRRLDLIIFTHFDKDHIGGAPELLAGIRADRVVMPAYEPDGKRYRALLEALDGAGLAAERLTADTSLAVGDMAIDIWTPKAPYEESDNDQSLVVRVRCGGMCALLMGDAEEARTRELLDGGYDLACDVLKLPHHGRLHETSAALLDAAAPRCAIITDSTKNPAEDELLSLLAARSIETLRTADGTVRVTLSGGGVEAELLPD